MVLPNMGMLVITVMLRGSFILTSVPPSVGGSTFGFLKFGFNWPSGFRGEGLEND